MIASSGDLPSEYCMAAVLSIILARIPLQLRVRIQSVEALVCSVNKVLG